MITVLNQEMTDYLQAKEYEYRAHKFLIGFANNHNLTKLAFNLSVQETRSMSCTQMDGEHQKKRTLRHLPIS